VVTFIISYFSAPSTSGQQTDTSAYQSAVPNHWPRALLLLFYHPSISAVRQLVRI